MKPFVTASNITIRLKDKFLFENTSWQMFNNENWLVIGPNGSGKTTFVKALAGLLPLKNGEIILDFLGNVKDPYPSVHKNEIAYLSFDETLKFRKQQDKEKFFYSFIGKNKKEISVKNYLNLKGNYPKYFGIDNLLEKNVLNLSTGETRKVLLIKQLIKKPKLLILDEPFDGLDKDSKKELIELIENIKDIQFILITHKNNEIPINITNIVIIEDGKIFAEGEKEDIKKFYPDFFTEHEVPVIKTNERRFGKPIIEMKDIVVEFNNKKILNNINWEVREGENWYVFGPNGAGKSTLINLITGEQLQAYANEIKLFGFKRDKISLWEIKDKISVVSSELLLNYQINIPSKDIILSGFFDSIGLYRNPTDEQVDKLEEIIKKLCLEKFVNKSFEELSFGQKRLILIARAIIKAPKILILDEPCHGLDKKNRRMILDLVDKISQSTSIIYITHNQEEVFSSITHYLHLAKGEVVSLGQIENSSIITA